MKVRARLVQFALVLGVIVTTVTLMGIAMYLDSALLEWVGALLPALGAILVNQWVRRRFT